MTWRVFLAQKFDTLQVLRGCAATLVVCHHIQQGIAGESVGWPLGNRLFSNGWIGVDIFFVISGFVIYYAAFRRELPSPREFLLNRFWRLLPPYWAVLLFMILAGLALYLVLGDPHRVYSWGVMLSSSFLVPIAPGDYVLGVAWTLSLEIMFYILFAIFALRFGASAFFVAMIVWYALGILGLFYSNDFSGWRIPALNPVIGEFMFGALIANRIIAGNTAYHRSAFLVGALLIVALLLSGVEPSPWGRREFVCGLPAALLIYGAAGVTWQWPNTLLTWGDSSYILYFIHLPFFNVIGRGIEELTGYNVYSSPFSSVAMAMCAIVTAYYLTLYVERPYQRFYKGLLRGAEVRKA